MVWIEVISISHHRIASHHMTGHFCGYAAVLVYADEYSLLIDQWSIGVHFTLQLYGLSMSFESLIFGDANE